ncbi:MAG: choice-of-anchor tandem repeat GloVer-containing protein, partial [Chthoniobacteraceae bacterium]
MLSRPHPSLLAILLSLCLTALLPVPTRAASTHELLASFSSAPQHPGAGALAQGGDGYYWGTTPDGGAYGFGTIYKVKADGSDWQVVLSFTGNGASNTGSYPFGGLVSDGGGTLWGTTYFGGTGSSGTVFKVNEATGVLTTLVEFTGVGGNNKGSYPYAALVS